MTATEDHAAALSKLREALEVEEAATRGPWLAVPSGVEGCGTVFHDEHVLHNDVDAVVLARALLRPALLNAIATLERHEPRQYGDAHGCPRCMDSAAWPCPDAQRALELAAHIPEGGAQ